MERIEVKRRNQDKKFKITYIVLGALFALVLIINIVGYVNYKRGQSKAIEIIKEDGYLMDEINCNEDDSDAEIASAAFSYFNYEPDSFHDYSQDEIDPEYNPYRDSDNDLGRKLEKEGYTNPYGSYSGSYFLEFSSFFEYLSDQYLFDIIKMHIVVLILIGLGAIVAAFHLLYKRNNKKSKYVIENGFLIHIDNNIEKEKYLISNIKSLELTKLNGIKIVGDGFLLKIKFIDNRDQIKDTLYNIMYAHQ